MITEDERWKEQFSDREEGSREGYRPYKRNENFNSFRPDGERVSSGGRMGQRPRIQRPRVENEGQRTGGYGYRREGGYQREGGFQRREGGSQGNGYRQREGAFRPRREGGYSSRPERPYREGGYQRRESGYQRREDGGYGSQRPYRQRTSDYNPHAKYSHKKQIEYKSRHYDPNEPIRLNKFLANSGVCSRREADDFIQAGVVRVNGQVVTELGTKVLRTDAVLFHDQLITPEKKVYVLLNKPKDTVTTSDDPQNRKTVMELVKDCCRERIYPVGRLDRNTTGVLLLTNDGELATRLTHPKFLKKKIYHVHLDKGVTAADMRQIAEGVELEDGFIKADEVEYADEKDKKQVGIEIHSGRNRIVRRIFEHLGYKVVKLDRVYFAGLTKKNLRRGDWRFLTEAEVSMLYTGMFE
ncbi:MAG: RNA-binding S4 domain-containing protein [Bacteroidaceae bacterium]|nr:RNA-binding S4 domain-containing protein [Bacteroidaceae bacterium]